MTIATFVRGLIFLAALSLSLPAAARHRAHANDAVAGAFDYYLLALSWSPAYCLQVPDAAECNGTRRYGFIVHGLWPQNERGRPENCAAEGDVSDSVVRSMLDIMPARDLIYHEWSAHGTCSGLSPADFFALTRQAYASMILPTLLSQGSAIEQPPNAIVGQFLRVNPRLSPQSIVATCSGQGAPRLREVHICFDRDLEPRNCSAAVLKAACRAATVIVPPLR